MKSILQTPVLFIIYNRPDLTFKVFEQIKKVKPYRLYIAADGCKENNLRDYGLCRMSQSVINQVNWDCIVETKFNKINLGCKDAVSSAINWFFEKETEGIIIEDDCFPTDTFFKFCSELLEYYRHDHTVGHIGGNNFQKGNIHGDGSYYFSKYPHVWGWATWKRAWNLYDINLEKLPIFRSLGLLDKLSPFVTEKYNWIDKFERTSAGKINTWDYQWLFTLWYNNLKSITPNVNMVSNLGFNINGTHTKRKDHRFANMPTDDITNIIHPAEKIINEAADRYSYNHIFRRFFLSNLYLILKYKNKKYYNGIPEENSALPYLQKVMQNN